MAIFAAVSADNPSNWWRLADPGGVIAADIGGATPRVPLLVPQGNFQPYSGMTSDGSCGARIGNAASYYNVQNLLPLLNLWTIECWAWNFAAQQQAVMSLEVDPGGVQIVIRLEANGNVTGFISGDGVVTWATNIGIQAWHHYALTYDHVTLRLYVDGVQRAALATVVTTNGNYSPLLGMAQGATSLFLGFLEDAAYYNATLSAASLLAHFSAADQLSTIPEYLGAGRLVTATGSSTPLSAELTDILNSVRKAY